MSDSQETVICTIHSPMNGKVYSLEDVPDPAFARGMIGEGIAIEPEDGVVYAPVDGTIQSVFETEHAIVFENDDHVKLLLHIGIGTMRLQGEGFTAHVETGQQVKKGDRLMSLDLNGIRKKAESMISPIVMTEPRKTCRIRVLADKEVSVGDAIFEVIQ